MTPERTGSVMRAVIFDGRVKVVDDHPVPSPPPGWALIRVIQAGICRTDLEIIRGYMGYTGVLGHEFVGHVVTGNGAGVTGQKVVGEINAPCGDCPACRKGLGRHCPRRAVLGIAALDGCMAEYCMLPADNLHPVPPDISDDRAVLVEPLSAACAVFEQVTVGPTDRVTVLGDGRLGILTAWAMAARAGDVLLVGHHADKLALADWRGIRRVLDGDTIDGGADIVVDATGSAGGLERAVSLCRPRGIVVLKTTVAEAVTLDLAPVVINELTVVGSRCGRFSDGLALMAAHPDMPLERLVSARYPIGDAPAAFDHAARGDALKVIIDC